MSSRPRPLVLIVDDCERVRAIIKYVLREMAGIHTVGAATSDEALTRMLHKPVEQMGGRGVRKLENSELYDNQLRRPEPNRL